MLGLSTFLLFCLQARLGLSPVSSLTPLGMEVDVSNITSEARKISYKNPLKQNGALQTISEIVHIGQIEMKNSCKNHGHQKELAGESVMNYCLVVQLIRCFSRCFSLCIKTSQKKIHMHVE